VDTQDMIAVAAEVELVAKGARVVEQTVAGDGFGLVLVERPDSHHHWVVWRWATKYTGGNPVGGASGAMLWSGGYWATRAEAEQDMRDRPQG
jgi:hypothetical protein